MGKPGAFLDIDRVTHELRPVEERSHDFDPLYVELDDDARRAQASRCMMCGVAFCQMGASFGKARPSGCPLHNLIPEWNELVYRGRWDEAAERLSLTSPMPEFTSRVCPALCEAACNLGSVDGQPTTIHDNERAISDHEWANGGPRRFEPAGEDAPSVAVVGSGPAGLVAAWELARRGARVTVFERDDRPGGLLMYGIPNMKLEKSVVERRVALMRELGIVFELGADVSDPKVTAVRQGARSVRQFEFLPAAPDKRAAGNPWPQWPNVKKTDYGQQEAIAAMGGEMRAWGVDTLEVLLDKKGAAAGLRVVDLNWSAGKPERIAGSEHEVPAQLVLIACGFTGPEHSVFDAVSVPVATAGRPLPVMAAEGSHLAARTEGVAADAAPVYVAGDARNGSSLVVSAMADALACAAEVADALEL